MVETKEMRLELTKEGLYLSKFDLRRLGKFRQWRGDFKTRSSKTLQ